MYAVPLYFISVVTLYDLQNHLVLAAVPRFSYLLAMQRASLVRQGDCRANRNGLYWKVANDCSMPLVEACRHQIRGLSLFQALQQVDIGCSQYQPIERAPKSVSCHV